MPTETTNKQYRKLARYEYVGSLDVDIETIAGVERNPAFLFAWIAAWVWIDEPRDTGEEKP